MPLQDRNDLLFVELAALRRLSLCDVGLYQHLDEM